MVDVGNIQWETPNTVIISGPSKSGKTTLCDKIIRNQQFLYKGDKIRPIILFTLTSGSQQIYENWQKDGYLKYRGIGTPNEKNFLEIIDTFVDADVGAIVIFDDLGTQIDSNFKFYENLINAHSHHKNIDVFLLLHKIFGGKKLRDISHNINKLIVTNNPRGEV